MAHTTDLSGADAKKVVSLGRFLGSHGVVRGRFDAGGFSRSRLAVLSGAANAFPEAFGRDEEMLAGFAAGMSMRDFYQAVGYWRSVVADREEKEPAKQRERSYLHASRMLSGMVRIDGQLDSERGTAVLTALQAALDIPTGDDQRSAANRRAEALYEICYQWLSRGEAPTSGGVKPHVSLIVDLETLMGRAGTDCRLADCSISAETARRILCDASVSRVITGPDSMPLDVGRASRTATPAQRRALAIRDGGCQAPGCDRPPEWCDVHHRTPWILGGETNLADLTLFCRLHHTEEHEKMIQLE